MRLAPATKLGPYVIISLLGAGGMGEVYRARDLRLERDVAIKVLPRGVLADDAARRRFRKEALALAKLSHPNIAAVYDVGEQDGADYLVMEYVPGRSLAHELARGPVSTKDAILWAEEIASALIEAHENGVIHRDLKPGNVMVTAKGRAKVLDFGLAKLFEPTGDRDITLSLADTNGPVGTPLYMSPEQAEGKIVDSRTDLWSLGVVLYESLSGQHPFRGDSALAVLRAVTQQDPKPPSAIRPDVPTETDQIVSRALEKDVAKRYQSASEISQDLSAVLVRLSSPATPPATSGFRLSPVYAVLAAVLILVAVASGYWLYERSEKRHWAREEALPAVARLQNEDKSLAAFLLLQKAAQYLPGEPKIAQMIEESASPVSVSSSPSGSTVEVQDYLAPESAWYRLGETPLSNVRIPNGYLRWKVSKQGVGEYISAPITQKEMRFALDAESTAPQGMLWVPGGPWFEMIAFVGWIGPYKLPPYYIDRFEVTNRQYQQFVDNGGYQKSEYWNQQFVKDARVLRWAEAMALFRDNTGRAGPSTWAGGHYPDGQADYPVSGVSWYEATAYAAFAGKSLPAFAQWFNAAPPEVATYAVRESNISLSKLARVGAFKGLGLYGTYDMAGNVREWVANQASTETNFILGGAWESQTYLYSDPEALSPFDRSATNGFRCVQNLTPLPAKVSGLIKTMNRDFLKAKPASDAVFRAYQVLYAYDKTPLQAKVEGVVQDSDDWQEEKITFSTAYQNARMAAYLFLPKKVQPPYQTVVFFPSARVLDIPTSQTLGDVRFFDYVVQSGRAVLYPVYTGTYERQDKLTLPGESIYLEQMALRYKDLARSIDYLETRSDIDKDKLAYLGVSMGSAEGVVYASMIQEKLKAVIFLDGGFFLSPPPKGGDQLDFAVRLKKPTLMVNGRYDFTFSLEKAQNPLFELLATPPSDKRHVLLESAHDVTARRPELVAEVLAWLDKYLGPVKEH
jgi:serine/threonine protein kinase/dienelactone hydrolase